MDDLSTEKEEDKIKHALLMQAFADTFHDFGSDNSDKRCRLSSIAGSVVSFHENNLKTGNSTNFELIDNIVPGNLKGIIGNSYEQKVVQKIEEGLDKEELSDQRMARADAYDMIYDVEEQYVGQIVDFGKSERKKPKFFVANTIAAHFDEAPKSKTKIVNIIVNFANYNKQNNNKNYLQIGHMEVGFGYSATSNRRKVVAKRSIVQTNSKPVTATTETDALLPPANEQVDIEMNTTINAATSTKMNTPYNFVYLGKHENALNSTVLSSKIVDLRVSSLCKMISAVKDFKQILEVCLGRAPESNRDNFMFKRIAVSGYLLSDIFKDFYNDFRVATRSKIDNMYEFGGGAEMEDLVGFINENNAIEVFTKSEKMMYGLVKSLKSNWVFLETPQNKVSCKI